MAARIEAMAGTVASFLAGAETYRATSPEYFDVGVSEEQQTVHLVSYGPYETLPSFDPDCLTAIVPRHVPHS